MATSPIPTTTNSQSQTATQSPQSGARSITTGTGIGNVQPSTASNLLNGPGSASLHATTLPSINLASVQPASQPSTVTDTQPAKRSHHVNSTFLGFSLVLFLLAAVLVWTISRSAKKPAAA